MFDPFQVLDLEKNFSLDMKVLEKAYFKAQKKTHPDLFMQAPEEVKKAASLHSSAVNRAYLALKDPLKRAEVLLNEEGVKLLSHDPAFLRELMAWQERVEAGENIREELLTVEKNLLNELEISFGKKEYEVVRKALYQLTYVSKLLKERR